MKKWILILPILLSGCTSEEPAPEQRAVIEAWIDNDGHPTVLLSTTITPNPDGGSLEDALIRWGKVTISDGTTETIMTGSRDSRYVPPYKYTTTELIGHQGTKYTITATFKELRAEASATMPAPTPIDSIGFAPCANDTLRATTLYFTVPPDVPAYYYLTISRPGNDAVARPCLMGWGEFYKAGEHAAIAVFSAKEVSPDFQAQLCVGQSYIVYLNRVEKPVYDFWRAFDDALLFGNNVLFGTNSSLPTNISGGYGIFSARAISSIYFTVK